VLHAISFIPVTILGIFFMAREGITLSRARSLAREGSEGSNDSTGVSADAADSADALRAAR
jgi:hypothetical protein